MNFSTFARRAAQVGSGLVAGSQERDQRLRSEQLDLMSRGLELGAQGVDGTPFVTEDMVSRGNRDFLRDFGQMGRRFTQPYYDQVAAETRAAELAHQQDIESRLAVEEYRRTNQAGIYRPGYGTGGGSGTAGRPYDLDDQLRLDEGVRERVGQRIISQMGLTESQAADLSTSGQLGRLIDVSLESGGYNPRVRDQGFDGILTAADEIAGRAAGATTGGTWRPFDGDFRIDGLDRIVGGASNTVTDNIDQINEVSGGVNFDQLALQVQELEDLVDTGAVTSQDAALRLQQTYGDAFTFEEYLFMAENGIPPE